jgi:protein arginine N-methyltransferase 1
VPEVGARSFFGPDVFATAAAAWAELSAVTGCTGGLIKVAQSSSGYSLIRIVNFIRAGLRDAVGRSEVDASGRVSAAAARAVVETAQAADQASSLWTDDAWLMPVLEDDGLIMAAFDDDGEEEEQQAAAEGAAEGGAGASARASAPSFVSLGAGASAALHAELSAAKSLIARLVAGGGGSSDEEGEGDGEGSPSKARHANDGYYFDSYSHLGIHEEMLRDEVRTEAYRRAIVDNPHLFKDKVVLDVGCGTGILSMFAAKAGAKAVIGVDMSDMVDLAKDVVRTNGLDGVVTLVKGKMEDIRALPHGIEKVDIIISEWMGYFLLYEGMLDSVLYARDRWLAPGGILLPDRATMRLAATEFSKAAFWERVYGFDMTAIGRVSQVEPLVDVIPSSSICSSAASFYDIDIATVTRPQLAFAASFEVTLSRPSSVTGLTAWFDVYFSHSSPSPVDLVTGPLDPYTHWKQTTFFLGSPTSLAAGDVLRGSLKCAPTSTSHRDLDISIEYEAGTGGKQRQAFVLK